MSEGLSGEAIRVTNRQILLCLTKENSMIGETLRSITWCSMWIWRPEEQLEKPIVTVFTVDFEGDRAPKISR